MAKGSKQCVERAPPSIADAKCDSLRGASNAKKAFSVHVDKHKWTTAQPSYKTIRDLITIVQRNAEKLGYFKDKDLFIGSLQLASQDDRELKDLDFDLTLGDLSVCMEGKHLVAVVKSNNPAPPPAAISTIATTDSQVAAIANATHAGDSSICSGVAHCHPPAFTDNVVPDENLTLLHSHKPSGRKSNLPAPKVTSSPAESPTTQIHSVDTECSFHADTNDGDGQSTTPDVQVAMAKSGAMATHGGGSSAKQQPLCTSSLIATMASFSDLHPVQQSPSAESWKTVPLARVRVNPSGAMKPPETTTLTMSGALRPDIEPLRDLCHPTKQFGTAHDGSHDHAAAAADYEQYLEVAYAEVLDSNIHENQGESPSAASEHVIAAMAPSSGNTVDSERSEDRTAFLVKRNIETGEEVTPPVPVKLSDLSPYFHLKLACAAEELGIPKSEFKRLCKNLGLIRWPSCKVRSLQKAIDRLELKVAQGDQTVQVEEFTIDRLNFLKECYDKLLHGTLAQMNTVVDSRAVLLKGYPRLYAEVLRSGDECQRCHGLINIQSNAITTQECDRLDDNSATEHSTDTAPHTASEISDAEGSLPIRRSREVRVDDVRVVGIQKAAKEDIMVAEEGTRGCTCYVVRRGKKWYPRFEREGPWLQHIAKTAMSL